MNLPNKLTLVRILLVPVFMVCAGVGQYGTASFEKGWYLAAGIVFALDFLKGQNRVLSGELPEAPISAAGWMVPISLLAAIMLMRKVSGRSAASTSAGSTRPWASTGR